MSERSRRGTGSGTAADGARVAGDPGVLGTALAVVLAFSLAQGSWQ
ncbi:hypothetical protein ACWDRR_27015 [Kitasatospora sp. NPDC003701]